MRLTSQQWSKIDHGVVKLQCAIMFRRDFLGIQKSQMWRSSLENFYYFMHTVLEVNISNIKYFGYLDKIDLKDNY